MQAGRALSLPVKHSFGRWYAPDEQLDALERGGKLVLRYAPGAESERLDSGCGRRDERDGNVMGLMPHPEHAVDERNGSADASRCSLPGSHVGALSPAAA